MSNALEEIYQQVITNGKYTPPVEEVEGEIQEGDEVPEEQPKDGEEITEEGAESTEEKQEVIPEEVVVEEDVESKFELISEMITQASAATFDKETGILAIQCKVNEDGTHQLSTVVIKLLKSDYQLV